MENEETELAQYEMDEIKIYRNYRKCLYTTQPSTAEEKDFCNYEFSILGRWCLRYKDRRKAGNDQPTLFCLANRVKFFWDIFCTSAKLDSCKSQYDFRLRSSVVCSLTLMRTKKGLWL